MSRVVTRCSNSTVTEAWATILGSPAPVFEDEMGALIHMARNKLPPLQRVPAIVFAPRGTLPVPPYWREQFLWGDGQHLARVGHRYVSVHFLRRSDRYDTFSVSIEPAISAWLEAARDAYGGDAEKYPVDRLGFGYVNTFEFKATDFDLSKYFLLNFGVEVPSAQDGLAGLEVRFRFIDVQLPNTHVTVELVVQPTGGGGSDTGLIVRTKVNAETHGFDDVAFGAVEPLSKAIVDAKEAAKRVFFEIATGDTHAYMGAVYDQG